MELELWQAVLVYGAMLLILIVLVGLVVSVGMARTPDNSDQVYPIKQHESTVNQNRKNTF